ncbi:MAG: GlsB/YeaQ/YmgE family stress response membrane protein [Burkholderiales bacterium]|nr:GlsB/YeaQ/YmgE family stress response membrane protein [Burkholderiales bacterium]
MDGMGFIAWIVIGIIAGWLGGKLMRGGGFGLLGNLVVGVVGAVVGGWVFGLLGISAGGWIGSIVMATVGAVVLLFIIGLIKKA